MLIDPKLTKMAAELGVALTSRGWRVTTAESCTGGAIGAVLTAVAGSSNWFEAGWVTYSNSVKTALLGVPTVLIEQYGVVSEPVVKAMLKGACLEAKADVGIAVSGIAGPGGAVPGKPVGTVCMAWGTPEAPEVLTACFEGDRDDVREASVVATLQGLGRYLKK